MRNSVYLKKMLLSRAGYLALSWPLYAGIATPCTTWAQIPPPPAARAVDDNGIDLITLSPTYSIANLSIGTPESGLSRTSSARAFPYGDNLFAGLNASYNFPDHAKRVTATFGDGAEMFGWNTPSKSSYSGSTITRPDGTLYTYDTNLKNESGVGYNEGLLKTIHRPDGEIIRFYYWTVNIPSSTVTSGGITITYPARVIRSLKSVSSNKGWMIRYTPVSTTDATVSRVSKITAINTSVDFCDPEAIQCTFSQTWPSTTYTYTTENNRGRVNVPVVQVKDSLNRTWVYDYATVINSPSHSSGKAYEIAVSYSRSPLGVEKYQNILGKIEFCCISVANPNAGPSQPSGWDFPYWDLIRQSTVSNYAFAKTSTSGLAPRLGDNTVQHTYYTTNDPSGKKKWTYTPTTGTQPTPYAPWFGSGSRTISVKDPFNNTTIIKSNYDRSQITEINNPNGFIQSYSYLNMIEPNINISSAIDSPEGNYVYDNRYNIIEHKTKAKPGSGLTDRIISVFYDPNCVNIKICNKPVWVRDALSNQTDYTYSPVHGGILTETLPADANGIRPQKRYTYQQYRAKIKNALGVLVDSDPIYLVSSISECTLAATCAGTANERITSFEYNHNNLFKTAVTVSSGDGVTVSGTTYEYDVVGNLIAEDGPLPGTVDKSYYRYDLARQKTGMIGPDPDGSGPLLRSAERYTYNLDGQLKLVEKGLVAGITDTDWANFQSVSQTETVYDPYGMPTVVKVKDGNTVISLTQTSYDDDLRPLCVATRMNPAVYGTLPVSACTLSAQGPHGPDRIIRYAYDNMGKVTEVKQAAGTPIERFYARYTYALNGLKTSERDANNNRTTLEYDGFDRLSKLRYPVTTAGANSSSTTDYEAYTYDANGNRLTHRRRDGQIIGFQYDNLNREVFRDIPGGTAKDVYIRYNLLGGIIHKRFGSHSGAGVSYAYDALGRVTSITDMNSRTVSYLYNQAGARSRLTFPETAHYLTYSVDYLNRLTGVTHSTAGSLFTQTYNNNGLRSALNKTGGSTGYSYDAVGRLTGMNLDLANTAYDVNWTFAYNPASQITTLGASNASYEYKELTAPPPDNRVYDGLNRDTTFAVMPGGYDLRGNLTKDDTRTFTYDVENRLLTATGGGANLTLEYDPEGRLSKYTSGSTVTTYLYDGVNLIGEYNGSTVLRRYVHGTGVDEPVVWFEGSNIDTTSRRYFYQNYQGSVIAYTNGSSVLTELYKYGPYGEPKNAANVESWTGASKFRYTGQTIMPEAELYYYKARVYDPNLGRFLQTDPIGSKDDLNLYAYVAGDPINGKDPTGTDCVTADSKTTCTSVNYKVSFTQQKGFVDFTTESKNYHAYSVTAKSSKNVEETKRYVENNPTPGSPKPASVEGTKNDATPVIGGLVPQAISPVTSFIVTNEVSGKEVVVNVTTSGHPLESGIVVREVNQTSDGTIINNWGEGTASLQSPSSPFADMINGVWEGQKPRSAPAQSPSPYCTAKIGLGC
ncbi:RHS repeat domain-containing protein [Asticcacaulis tiandongensis]|uniref:RHS repeat domain-containing protein n=1 Tax=Asticcacaulis tiandongensis TaxID=2565365 RepID=UPI001127711D|nr:RHS repeat-associated core domain-containing protein [Asticcacaulis tiandongensis]